MSFSHGDDARGVPDEDVIDRLATLLINGPNARNTEDPDARYPYRGDAISEPYKRVADSFPYLVEPYEGFDEGKF